MVGLAEDDSLVKIDDEDLSKEKPVAWAEPDVLWDGFVCSAENGVFEASWDFSSFTVSCGCSGKKRYKPTKVKRNHIVSPNNMLCLNFI